jgi:cobalt-zinc-cadmium efflux system outer membrane protein
MDVLTQVTRAFVDVLAAQELVALTAQTTQLVEQVQQSVAARVVAGVVSPIEETKADVALALARVETDRATRLLEANRERLAALWGAPEATFQRAAGDLNTVPSLPPATELTARLAGNPDLAQWAVEISRGRAALAVERSKLVPDMTLTAGFRRFSDTDGHSFLIGASLPLPLFDRNQGGIAEARKRLAKAYEEERAAESRVRAALAEAYRALSTAHAEAMALRTTVLPGARQIFEAVSEGYRLGRFGYLDALDAQRTLIGASNQYLRALAEYHKAVADVERLIGAPLN